MCAASCQKVITPTDPTGLPSKLTLANFEKIHDGMTLQEVEAILGPPGAKTTTDQKGPDGAVIKKEVHSASWFWDRVSSGSKGNQVKEETRRIVVHLKDGKVSSKEQVGLE
jgi:hypothetical protein